MVKEIKMSCKPRNKLVGLACGEPAQHQVQKVSARGARPSELDVSASKKPTPFYMTHGNWLHRC